MAPLAHEVIVQGGVRAVAHGPEEWLVDEISPAVGSTEFGPQQAGLALALCRENKIRQIEKRDITGSGRGVFHPGVALDGDFYISSGDHPVGRLPFAGGDRGVFDFVGVFTELFDPLAGKAKVVLPQQHVSVVEHPGLPFQIQLDTAAAQFVFSKRRADVSTGHRPHLLPIELDEIGPQPAVAFFDQHVAFGNISLAPVIIAQLVGIDAPGQVL